jgi:hydroxyacylglutathione hydrolase
MFFERLYDEKLAQASYLIGCEQTGEALVVDPLRDPDLYVRRAAEESLRITHVTETHIHADFLSGSRDLAARTRARLHLSDEGGQGWRYAFAESDGAVLLKDRSMFMVGNVRIDVLHTPGHTPEHIAFVVTDSIGASGPMGVLTGDFLFVGDVGRPDLLEKTAAYATPGAAAPPPAGAAASMVESARHLFKSLAAFSSLPDYLQIWPGHGAGSACGKALGAMPQSTLGYEKRFNWAFQLHDEASFVAAVLEGQPDPPRYFATMKRLNRDGPPPLPGVSHTPLRLDPVMLPQLLASGATVIDVRATASFAAGHIPGTVNIPLGRSFPTWAGWLVPYDVRIALIADSTAQATEAARDLSLIGLDQLAGAFVGDAMPWWSSTGRQLEVVVPMSAHELAARRGNPRISVIDVRADDEWRGGHIPGARHIPLGHLSSHLETMDAEHTYVLQCQGGSRSAIAASLLLRHGIRHVANLDDGMTAWERAGLPVSRDDAPPHAADETPAADHSSPVRAR